MSIPIGTRIPPRLGSQGIEAVAAFAQSSGLTALDLPSLSDEAAKACQAHGLRIGTVDANGAGQLLSKDAGRRQEAVDRIQSQIRQLAELGGKVVFMCLVPEDHTQPIRESLTYFTETFPAIAEECERSGVKIAFEGWPGPGPHYPTLGCTPEVWRAMFAAVPSPALGLCFDPSHLVRMGIDYLRVFAEFKDRIHHCHGKDTQLLAQSQYLYGHMSAQLDKAPGFSEGSWRYCIPGDGEVDWRRVAFELSNINYEGCVSIELEDARYWGTLEKEQEGIAKAFAHLSEQLA
ncbi:sugar phosphate isomerase/epimerase family protein [Alicyclobacillus fodiniaquatilis]|uniref:Sugar phosphate isomerase/epimerase family protein n=1 Tax=Alicyclobacillus fodiniaquatilis TaxID=1661150 RepID=A0ABW4JRD2_9BACL